MSTMIEWADEGFRSDAVDWWDEGAFDPKQAGELKKAGIDPSDLKGLRYRGSSLAYAHSNRDISLEGVLELIERS